MSYRKVLVGIFMAGFLCCGIGAGVMFQEYSSFQYMGEKRIGSNKIAEKTFMENLYTDKTKKLNTTFTKIKKIFFALSQLHEIALPLVFLALSAIFSIVSPRFFLNRSIVSTLLFFFYLVIY